MAAWSEWLMNESYDTGGIPGVCVCVCVNQLSIGVHVYAGLTPLLWSYKFNPFEYSSINPSYLYYNCN